MIDIFALEEMTEIVEMAEEDLLQVLEIENLSFAFPWSEDLFEQELKSEFSKVFLAKKEENRRRFVAGYTSFWSVVDEIHIVNLAVHPRYRRNGIGTALISFGLDYYFQRGDKYATLEVRKSNVAALRLYKKLGFEEEGVRYCYYPDNWEDAIIMGISQVGLHLEAKSIPVWP